MSDVELDYDYLTQRALRRVVRDVLVLTAELGATPGKHHFYIEFQTGARGVTIPDELKADYPDRMTIVLQHQFVDLIVAEEGFAVTLWFKGRQSRLSVPFDAVTSFADPSVQFGLKFHADAAVQEPSAEPTPAADGEPAAEASLEPPKEGADVVRLDAFRKK